MSQRHRHEYAADFPRGLPGDRNKKPKEFRPPTGSRAHRTRPISTRFESVTELGRNDAGSSRTPLRHAHRTRTIWQYWHVPALSGLLPPSPAPPGSGCPQLRCPAATGPTAKVSHLHSNQQRLTAQIARRSGRAASSPLGWPRGLRCMVLLGRCTKYRRPRRLSMTATP